MTSTKPRVHFGSYNGGDELDAHAERIIGREVLWCQTGLVERLLEQSCHGYDDTNSISRDDITNSYTRDGDEGYTPKEIFEWWLVTEWGAEKLDALDEPLLTDGHNHWWGRTITGQSILLDGVWQAIYHKISEAS